MDEMDVFSENLSLSRNFGAYAIGLNGETGCVLQLPLCQVELGRRLIYDAWNFGLSRNFL